MGKRILDCAVSLAVLALASPVLIAAAVAISVASPGPVLYRGRRVGLNGRMFRVLKFRTMVVGAELLGGSATADDDPRVTRIGALMRKCKIDELPQLLNVLRGDMSLVGPRPEVKKFVDMYSEEEREILTVQPGITDWASLWNFDEGAVLAGSEDPERDYEHLIRPTKLHLQLMYVRNRSLTTDLVILFHTAMRIVFRHRWVPGQLRPYAPWYRAQVAAVRGNWMQADGRGHTTAIRPDVLRSASRSASAAENKD